MLLGNALDSLRRAVESVRAEYEAAGRSHEFDAYVEALRADDRWPFDR